MYKVFIEKRVKREGQVGEYCTTYISLDVVRPFDISNQEWEAIITYVKELADGNKDEYKDLQGPDCVFDLERVREGKDWGILAESEHYYIRKEYEDASLYRKPDSRRITCVGDFYGEPEDAYIDPQERFCITAGCGIIKYNLQEPFESYMYDKTTPQWIEVGRGPDNTEWCDCIEEVTESYVVVSCEGEDRRMFSLDKLKQT